MVRKHPCTPTKILLWTGIAVFTGMGCSPQSDEPPRAPPPVASHPEVPNSQGGAPPARPNVLMIAFDTVRADRMSAYGGPRPTTPNLDALAARGTRFADCTSQAPFTPHSFSSMFASIHVADLPVRERAHPESNKSVRRAGLESYHITLSEVLHEAGYVTGAVVRSWFTNAFGLTQGFEWIAHAERERPDLPEVVRTSVRWLQQWQKNRSDQPFFLFVYTMDVHYPFMNSRPPKAHIFEGDPKGFSINRDVVTPFHRGKLTVSDADLRNTVALYDEGLYWADQEIQPLLDELDALGLADDTIVVFVSDHGEEFGEHGYLSHGQNNFRTSVSVPLIIRAPGFPENNVVNTPVMNIDVMPTILDLCHVPIPETVKGLSLAPSLRGEAQPELGQRYIFSEGAWTGFVGLARAGNYGYLQDHTDQPFLFDLARDPGEAHNLAAEHPDLAERLRRVLFQHKREGLATQLVLLQGGTLKLDRNANPIIDAELFTHPVDQNAAPVLSEESIEQLKALGYLE